MSLYSYFSVCVVLMLSRSAMAENPSWKFDFGAGEPAPGFTKVTGNEAYSAERGWGFEGDVKVEAVDRGGEATAKRDFVTSKSPFSFSIKAPPGNYRVTLTLGDAKQPGITTVKAESRRLMLENIRTAEGEFTDESFTVNIRTADIPGGGRVKLKEREKANLHWDDKLTVEFLGDHIAVCSMSVEKVDDALTVFLAGDSTVTDQANEPWNSWGQMLTRFMQSDVAVANHAESGETLKSSDGAGRLKQILATIKPGDYLFIQFGHNDMKDKTPGAGAFTTYKESLTGWVTQAKEKGANVVLVTSMHRRRFDDAGKVVQTLGDYPEAVRQVGKEQDVPVIDLNEMSKLLYEALGPDGSKAAFQDGTHHNNYGSYELARCVVEGIKSQVPELAKHLRDTGSFNPSKPDAPESFAVQASPNRATTKPDGN